MSAITLIGTTGQAYTDGMRFIQFYFGLPLAMIILCVTAVPFFYRARVFTAYEYLEKRFDARTRTLTSFFVGKFAQEFLLMAMVEFDVIRLPDGYVQSSSIMTQKRNPVAIEHIRAIASKALGQTLGVLTSVHNTPFGDINDVEDDLQPLNFAAVRDAIRAVSLLGHALGAAEFNLDLLRDRAEENFITVTELADIIVRRDDLPFSQAQAIVANCVAAASKTDGAITYENLQEAARATIGRTLSISANDMAKALSAENFIMVRSIYGGPAPDETRAALEQQRDAERADTDWLSKARDRLQRANRALDDTVSAALKPSTKGETS